MFKLLITALMMWPTVRLWFRAIEIYYVTGAVVAVTDSTITLDVPEGKERVTRKVPGLFVPGARIQPPGAIVRTIEIVPAEPRKGMFVSRSLRTGGLGTDRQFCRYPLRDVRVGDKVSVLYYRLYGVIEVVTEVQINRRPGGHLPPCPTDPIVIYKLNEDDYKAGKRLEDLPYDRQLYHEKLNALEDWVSWGIPIPHHLHPGGNQAAVAPPPRRAGPRTPPANP
jgi:hypothetical protein